MKKDKYIKAQKIDKKDSENMKEKILSCFEDRMNYAKTQFEENDIPYKLWNESIGYFNLLDSKGEVLMSFCSYTGKLYIPSTGFSENVGIKNCIKKYKDGMESNKGYTLKELRLD